MITNFKAAKQFIKFSETTDDESSSGPGSSIANTVEVRNLIQKVIVDYGVKSILDLGCGDWNWFKLIDLNGIEYEGWDAGQEMIIANQLHFGRDNVNFKTYDIILSEYPDVDLIICRDVLFHLPMSLAYKVIRKSKLACKYFISTSFREVPQNKGIGINNEWGYYPINLNITPFNLEAFEVSSHREMLGADPNGIILSPKRYVSLFDFSRIEKNHF